MTKKTYATLINAILGLCLLYDIFIKPTTLQEVLQIFRICKAPRDSSEVKIH